MAKRKIIPTEETLRLEAEPGYAANGMSLYSRTARKPRGGGGDIAAKFRDRPPARLLIEQQERKLCKLRADLLIVREPDRLAHIRRDINAKENFLRKLWAELAVRP